MKPSLVCLALISLTGCGAFDQLETGTGRRSDSLLSLFAPPEPARAAAWAIDDLNADNRYRGTIILANASYAGEDVYLELFRDNMNRDKEPYAIVRAAAVRGLAHHGLPSDAERLLDALENDDSLAVRTEVVRALQRIHSPEAVGPLIRLLRDRESQQSQIRAEAANALAQYPEGRVFDALVLALGDDSLLVNQAALGSLEILTGVSHGESARAWFDWRDQTEAIFANRTPYLFPVFERGRKYYEWFPLVPDPPNETASTPVGFAEPEPEFTVPPIESSDDSSAESSDESREESSR